MNRSGMFAAKRGLLLYLAIVAGVLFLLNRLFFETYLISGDSMNNTLVDGDKVLVLKNRGRPLTRNCIAVFAGGEDIYVKRCIGLPGDTIEIKSGKIFVNGCKTRISGVELVDAKKRDAGLDFSTLQYYGRYWNRDNFGPLAIPAKGIVIPLDTAHVRTYQSVIEAEQNIDGPRSWEAYVRGKTSYRFTNDYYFMVGDNRAVSDDSRTRLGLIPGGAVVGSVRTILYSHANWRRIFKKAI